MKTIYLDHAATTPVHPEAEAAMLPYFRENYANPSAAYKTASEVREKTEQARAFLAKTLHAKPAEIYFTSGGTESDNWAIKGAARLLKAKGRHIITSAIEHHAVLNSCADLEREGFQVTYLGVSEQGEIRLSELEKAIRPDTILISVMYANNEVGTIQPVAGIGAIASQNGIIFHTDAVQAYGQLPIDVNKSHIDLLSASGHKLNGPKGTGFLYVNEKIPLPSLLYGGGQERGKRAGTENVPGIIGFGKAAEIACKTRAERERHIAKMRDHLIARLLSEIPYTRLNGSRKNRLPGNCNVSFQFVRGAELLSKLNEENICASVGAACTCGASAPSHVLLAMGLPENIARGTLRLTIGYENTFEEIDYTADCIRNNVAALREKSEEYQHFYIR